MPNRDIEFYIVNIFIAIEKIRNYTLKFNTADELLHSMLEWDATIRELEIIGEATNNLLKSHFIDEKYRIIVDFRNQINHGYFGINHKVVWEVVNSEIDTFAEELLKTTLLHKKDLSDAITCAKEENNYSIIIIKFLNHLENKLDN
ncbi:MAG: DUF86 domain-containing protein [Helicobacteraceae bacterium]|nr:DUF86 domain-containing protein [Helicobacteraceae bacterium]